MPRGTLGWLRRFWRGIREASGDAAYERYLEHGGETRQPLDREAFYLDSLRRRYRQPEPLLLRTSRQQQPE